jgi:hypothetical protein
MFQSFTCPSCKTDSSLKHTRHTEELPHGVFKNVQCQHCMAEVVVQVSSTQWAMEHAETLTYNPGSSFDGVHV